MKIKHLLGAGALSLAALATTWVVWDPVVTIEIPHERINAALAEQLPRQEKLSGARVTINEASLFTAENGRLNVEILADLDLSGMAGEIEITTSGIPDYKDLKIFFLDPVIENLEYEFPSMNVSSRSETAGSANALVTYMLPSITSKAVTRLQSAPIADLTQDGWKQRAAAAVLSGIKVKNDGFDVMLHPARIVPHTLTSRHTPVILSIILLCGFLVYGYRSTQGSAYGKLRKPQNGQV